MNRLAAILLAAGASRRFAGGGKLMQPLAGRPLADWLFDTVGSLGLKQAVVVMRPDADEDLRELAQRRGIAVVVNEQADDGVGASIAAGAAALGEVEGAFISPADMPLLAAAVFRKIGSIFFESGGIVAPRHAGRRGHPVLFGQRHFSALRDLSGDVGARIVIERAKDAPVLIDTNDAGVLFDVDAQGDLIEAEKLLFERKRALGGFRPPAT